MSKPDYFTEEIYNCFVFKNDSFFVKFEFGFFVGFWVVFFVGFWDLQNDFY